MMALPALLDGLSWRRAAWTATMAALAAATIVHFFVNSYLDLLVSALCVGFSIMLMVTVASNLRTRRVPREALLIFAVIVGSVIGTIITGAVKGRNPVAMLQHDEALWR
ncbi:MAG: hypothetical protein ABI854_09170, partial [Betaproteobacteria bacterium]